MSEIVWDAGYEYDAPKFYDFKREDDGDSMASKWFDGHEEQENGNMSPLSEVNTNVKLSSLKKSAQSAQMPSKTSNIVTAWGSATATKKTRADLVEGKPSYKQQSAIAQATKQALHSEIDQENCNPKSKAPITRSASRSRAEDIKRLDQGLPMHIGHHAATSAPPPKGRDPHKGLQLSGPTLKSPRSRADLIHHQRQQGVKNRAGAGSARPGLGVSTGVRKAPGHQRQPAPRRSVSEVPLWPSHMASSDVATSTFNSKAQDRLKRVLQPRLKVMSARSTKPLTVPDELELHTSKRTRRLGNKSEALAVVDQSPNGTPFKSLASKVREFQSKTPARFRSRPAPAPKHRPLSITEPLGPNLETSARAKPSHFKGQEQIEMEQLAGIKKFQATKINPSVLLGSQVLGPEVPHGQALKPTQPEPFVFVSDDRAERRRRQKGEGEEGQAGASSLSFEHDHSSYWAFKACPLNRSILEGPVGIPIRQRSRKSTVPKSPLLQTKLRAKEAPPSEEPRFEFHARPVPQFLQVPREFHQPIAPVQPAPFNLRTEKRGREYEQQWKLRLDTEERQARAARIPKAQLLPLSLDVRLVPPKPEPRGLTMPRPFNLRSETRHKEYLESLTKEQRAEEEANRAAAAFKARPLPTLSHGFKIHESDVPLTMPMEPTMATDMRAHERAEFNRAVEEKAKLTESQHQAEEALKAASEEQAVRALRRGLVFSARPVPDFSRPFMAMPSDQALTNPITPKLGRKKAKRARRGA